MESIFKSYDIRGLYPQDLNENTAYKIGKAFAKFLNAKKVVVGRDMRESSGSLFDALAKGIAEMGCNVIDIGLCTTPMLYFAVTKHKGDGGIMITASHNPKGYNGLKLTRKNATPISGETGIMEIKSLVEKDEFEKAGRKGRIRKKDISESYKKHVFKIFKPKLGKRLKVVVDAANAVGSLEVKSLEGLPIDIMPLYFELDGNFPNHEADPLKEENLEALKKEVIKQKADLGVAFDGDGDRVGFVDENGDIIQGDLATALIASSLLKGKKGSNVHYDVRCSRAVREMIEENGGNALMCRVGHAFIKETMKKESSLFGGELSCHFYFNQGKFIGESSIGAVIHMLKIMDSKNKKMSAIVKPLRKYCQSGEINSTVDDPEKVMRSIESKYAHGKVCKIDGLRIDFDDHWFGIRKSNTEPLLRLNVEANTKEKMEEKRDEILSLIRKDAPQQAQRL